MTAHALNLKSMETTSFEPRIVGHMPREPNNMMNRHCAAPAQDGSGDVFLFAGDLLKPTFDMFGRFNVTSRVITFEKLHNAHAFPRLFNRTLFPSSSCELVGDLLYWFLDSIGEDSTLETRNYGVINTTSNMHILDPFGPADGIALAMDGVVVRVNATAALSVAGCGYGDSHACSVFSYNITLISNMADPHNVKLTPLLADSGDFLPAGLCMGTAFQYAVVLHYFLAVPRDWVIWLLLLVIVFELVPADPFFFCFCFVFAFCCVPAVLLPRF